MYTARFTVAVDSTVVTPLSVAEVGYAGDHLSARLIFEVCDRHVYRLELVDGGGAYDITEPLTVNEQGEVVYDIPSQWTAPGTATVRLVRYGDNEQVTHYAPVSLYFADREEGVLAEHHRPRFEVLLETAETAVDRANAAADRVLALDEQLKRAGALSDLAKETADAARDTAQQAFDRAASAKGVYVGSGEMPDGYAVQIDPNGAVLTPTDAARMPYTVLYEGDANAVTGYAYTAPTAQTDGVYGCERFRVFKAWVGDLRVAEQAVTVLTIVADMPLSAAGGVIGETAQVDQFGERFYLKISFNQNGQVFCNGTRTDTTGVVTEQGLYRLAGVM